MILTGVGKDKWRWILVELLIVLFVSVASAAFLHYGLALSPVNVLLNTLRVLLTVVFLIVARHDLALLFRRPGRNMGTGLGRMVAVARTTMLEAWAGRIWLLPVLWLIASFILIFSVRPFDETERIPLYIKMLLSGQEVLMLVIIWVMACVSLPRERERKTVVTTASKPLSRLEMLLGKIGGFTAITGVTLAIMCAASLVILYTADLRVRSSAGEAYEIQKQDFAKTLKTPDESLKALNEQGSLFAYNSITVAPDDMSILGRFDPPTGPPDNQPAMRFIKGGSQEKAFYKFTPRLLAPLDASIAPAGVRPYFEFYFPIVRVAPGNTPIKLQVNAQVSQSHRVPPPKPQSKELTLSEDGVATWEPDSPDELYSYLDPTTGDLMQDGDQGEVTLDVQCTTPDVLLQVLDGGTPDPVTGELPPNSEPNIRFFLTHSAPTGMMPRAYWPDPYPRVRGFERHDRQEVAGPTQGDNFVEYAVYRFPSESLRHVPLDASGNFTLALNFETYRAGSPGKPTLANIDVFSTDNPQQLVKFPDQEVLEKRMMHLTVPGTALGDPDPAKRGDMYVRVYTYTPGHSISLLEDSVRIELKPTPFFLNFMKGELVVLLEALVLISICVVCSIRLGWPVAMFCSSVIVSFGFMLDFLVDMQEYGGLGALNYRSYQMNPAVFKFFDSITSWTWEALAVMAQAVPNFTFYRYPQDYIPKLNNIPWHAIGYTSAQTIGFVLPVIAVGYLLFRKQELG